ncbi:PQQ-binding-like beta-propeller repeat protein [candidate division KSB1 bacterium]|nr:PQQ-binding-like beta-propeller repeat protein [candidate division KSB1 bacterium]MBL7093572.1 PQQ-binding-like beta-propeller repeat protein [candidate division KSB1 bacterium]
MLKRNKQTDKPAHPKPLRLWPGVIIVILQLLIRFVTPIIIPGAIGIAVFGGLIGGFVIIVWWAFFSRANHLERWGAVVLIIVGLIATPVILHDSIAKGGMGMLFIILAMPFLSLAFVVWAIVSRHLSTGLRRVTMVATILLACAAWALIRTGGLDADFNSDFAWRWAETPEEQLLAQADDKPTLLPSDSTEAETEARWPGFRGTNRDGIIHGTQIKTDWVASPPVELWRQQIGPAWSSFAVHGNLFYTQEQRGENEVVSCYKLTTGESVWRHSDADRFWESNSGAGPRGTPTLSNGRLYTLGATGILNVLDAKDGSVVWSRYAASDTETKTPFWGFSSSPLVVDDVVIVAVASTLAAYELATGDLRWVNHAGSDCYSSPHLLSINGIAQILLQNKAGVSSVVPANGKLLWEHTWPGYPIVQPAMIADGEILISVNDRSGVRRITVKHGPHGWTVEERWTSERIKPYFNDSAIHNGFVYGFDGRSLACIDIKDGTRKWKGGRYGRGQFVLLADQDLLLVLSDKGELALVQAVPEQFTELARYPAIKGKTWNHPVLVNGILLVRNSQEMAAFRLSLASKIK